MIIPLTQQSRVQCGAHQYERDVGKLGQVLERLPNWLGGLDIQRGADGVESLHPGKEKTL